jgi:hypothetical protein
LNAFFREAAMFEIELTPEQEVAAQRIQDVLMAQSAVECRWISRLLASKPNRELFGETEFQVRDAVHRIGARGLDAALEERKKRGTEGRAPAVHAARTTPDL